MRDKTGPHWPFASYSSECNLIENLQLDFTRAFLLVKIYAAPFPFNTHTEREKERGGGGHELLLCFVYFWHRCISECYPEFKQLNFPTNNSNFETILVSNQILLYSVVKLECTAYMLVFICRWV